MSNVISSKEKARYERHVLLKEIGLEGQEKLKFSRALVIGVGGLGNPVSTYLASTGVGTIGLVDSDTVSLSNLHRQTLFREEDIGHNKVNIAKKRLEELNPYIDITTYHHPFTLENGCEIAKSYDVMIDCTDNFKSRYTINMISNELCIPLVQGSIYKFEGQLSVFNYRNGPCYQCIYPTPPNPNKLPNCSMSGVLGVLPATIGSLQAMESIKLLLGIGTSLSGRLLVHDALHATFMNIRAQKDPNCPLCSHNKELRPKQVHFSNTQQEPSYEIEWKDAEKQSLFIIDIRTKEERDLYPFPNSTHVPMEEFTSRPSEIHEKPGTALFCASGVRSYQMVKHLREKGHRNIFSLKGGINQKYRQNKDSL